MDTIIYMDENGMPNLLTHSSKPSIVMDLQDAVVEVEDEAIDGKTYVHIRKENGITLTLVMSEEGEMELSKNMLNLGRIRKGLPPLDIDALWHEATKDYKRGEE